MSNDLISRKAVLESIDELLKSPYATSNEYYTCHIRDGIKMVRDVCVKASGTAFDVEEVIKYLESEIAQEIKRSSVYGKGHRRVAEGMAKAIDIVKKGGTNV